MKTKWDESEKEAEEEEEVKINRRKGIITRGRSEIKYYYR